MLKNLFGWSPTADKGGGITEKSSSMLLSSRNSSEDKYEALFAQRIKESDNVSDEIQMKEVNKSDKDAEDSEEERF